MMIKAITDITIILYLHKKLASEIERVDLNNYFALLNSPTTCIKKAMYSISHIIDGQIA